jgi:hypothetical protein
MTLDTAFHHTKLHKQFRMKIVDYITKSRSESFCAIPNSFVAEFVAEGSIIKFTKVCFGSNEIHKGAI